MIFRAMEKRKEPRTRNVSGRVGPEQAGTQTNLTSVLFPN
jgi:hypothetical protein